MASAIGIALISTILQPMAAKAMNIIKDKGKAIVRSMADKAMDKAMGKVLDTPMDRAMAMVVDKVDGIVNIERDISNLQITLRMIQGILQVAEEKQIDDDFIRNWLRDLVDIAYEARDVLDDFITFSSCVITAEEASNPVNFISSFMLSYVGGLSSDTSNIPLAILNRLAKDIRSVRERFDEKIKESETYTKLKSVVGGGGSESVRVDRRPEVGPFINKQRDALFLGREEVKQGIMKKILHPSDDHVHVVVIWGMGGIGKTTLALSIYNDRSVKKVPRRWLCVGESKFCAEKVIKEIVNDKNTTGIENLQTKLVDKLSGDRFLIVLDDVWDVDGSEWDLLFNPLTEVGIGGLIIITRRERDVCPAAITIQTAYNLESLSEEDSWSIFESCAYVNGKSDSTPDLKGIGKKIVKKLNGLPLALKVVGRSLLHKDSSTWTNFLESNLTKDDKVMSELRWSYNHLPPHLKMCFTYCALFPKGHVFYKKLLVQMWMAHDLIQTEEEKRRPEDVGAEYFEELVNASLLHNASLLQCVYGNYVMHDLIHDLAVLVSNGEFASTISSSLTNDQMKKVRHITITARNYSKIPRLCNIEKLLTLYTIGPSTCTEKFDFFFKLKSIRVLVLSGQCIEIPDCINALKHLRYLNLIKTTVKSLPDSLCRLYNLQMIEAPFVDLPRDVVKMVNLRYIRANLSTCKGVGKLTSLQELSSIYVCEGDNIRELGDMQRLRGRLRIEGLENVTSKEDAAGALMEKQTLMDELLLEFNQDSAKSTISAQVLDALGCPPNLTYLGIDGYIGLKSPSWMVDGKHKFDKLETLRLYNCPKLESLPPLGEFRSLKHLYLRNVGVKRLGDEFYGKFNDNKVFFPSLESLELCEMEEWEEWDDIIIENSDVSSFPRLTTLVIERCPKLVSVSIMNALVSLKDLMISDCCSLVHITSGIYIDSERLSSLQFLDIYSCEQLQSLPPNDKISSLKCLKIKSCSQLQSLPPSLVRLFPFQFLIIRSCDQFQSLPPDFHKLSSLEILMIIDCPQLQSLPPDFHKLSSLNTLWIQSCSQLQSLPPSFGKLSSLQFLYIDYCEQLQSLPPDFHKLSSLEKLNITYCEQLQSLPPDFHQFSSLEKLRIISCPQLQSLKRCIHSLVIAYLQPLEERCKLESGHVWHQIKHIRDIYLSSGEHNFIHIGDGTLEEYSEEEMEKKEEEKEKEVKEE